MNDGLKRVWRNHCKYLYLIYSVFKFKLVDSKFQKVMMQPVTVRNIISLSVGTVYNRLQKYNLIMYRI
jgi:hypothetical protein